MLLPLRHQRTRTGTTSCSRASAERVRAETQPFTGSSRSLNWRCVDPGLARCRDPAAIGRPRSVHRATANGGRNCCTHDGSACCCSDARSGRRALPTQRGPPTKRFVNGQVAVPTGGHLKVPTLRVAQVRLVRRLLSCARASRMRNDSPSVTTTWQWCRSRSSMLTAVVCSGRKRPQDSNGQCDPMPSARRS